MFNRNMAPWICIGLNRCYMNSTMDRRMLLDLKYSASIDQYPDANFAGLYGHQDEQDTHCEQSHTDFVALTIGCFVL